MFRKYLSIHLYKIKHCIQVFYAINQTYLAIYTGTSNKAMEKKI